MIAGGSKTGHITTDIVYNDTNDPSVSQHDPTFVKDINGKDVNCGKYVSITAIKDGGTDDDAVVAVWWDSENRQLLYSYNLTPKSIQPNTFLQSDTKWTTPVPIFDSDIGEYCKITADSSNGIHIAAYDGINADVWYAYIPDFKTPSSKTTCIVDSYGLIGTEINIDVGKDDEGILRPHISYYAGSCAKPKIAKWVGAATISSSEIKEGTTDDCFTGEWEVSLIPTKSKVSEDHINVGLWKSNGTIAWSTKDRTENGTKGQTSYTTEGSAADKKSYGSVWGNGSKNAVLGYAITQGTDGFIETAQMR